MNQATNEEEKHRSTDGVTVIKVLAGSLGSLMTLFMGVIAWVYVTNTADFKTGMKELVTDVRSIREQGIITYAHVQNSDARIAENSVMIKELHNEAKNWRN